MAGVDSERTGAGAERGLSAKSANSEGKSARHARSNVADPNNDAESQVGS
jgi:hypothetical protein